MARPNRHGHYVPETESATLDSTARARAGRLYGRAVATRCAAGQRHVADVSDSLDPPRQRQRAGPVGLLARDARGDSRPRRARL